MKKFIVVTTQIDCPNRCDICPQKEFLAQYKGKKAFDFDSFCAIIDKIPLDVSIHFSGMSEPFINPLCSIMIDYAKKYHHVQVFTTMVGLKDVVCLTNLERLVVHLPDKNHHFSHPITKEYFSKLELIKNIPNVEFMTMDKDNKTVDELRHINISTEFEYDSRCGLNFPSKRILPHFICSKSPDYMGWTLFPNGDVYLCVNDWLLKHHLGNLFNQTYDEVLNSNNRKYIMTINKQFGTIQNKTICSSCFYAKRSQF